MNGTRAHNRRNRETLVGLRVKLENEIGELLKTFGNTPYERIFMFKVNDG